MKPTKPSANEKRLAKLLWEAYAVCSEAETVQTWDEFYAAFLAKRGVLAVCAATVPEGQRQALIGWQHPKYVLGHLRSIAKGHIQ
jgi:hypothetical protein